jgi:hypothetical protein
MLASLLEQAAKLGKLEGKTPTLANARPLTSHHLAHSPFLSLVLRGACLSERMVSWNRRMKRSSSDKCLYRMLMDANSQARIALGSSRAGQAGK